MATNYTQNGVPQYLKKPGAKLGDVPSYIKPNGGPLDYTNKKLEEEKRIADLKAKSWEAMKKGKLENQNEVFSNKGWIDKDTGITSMARKIGDAKKGYINGQKVGSPTSLDTQKEGYVNQTYYDAIDRKKSEGLTGYKPFENLRDELYSTRDVSEAGYQQQLDEIGYLDEKDEEDLAKLKESSKYAVDAMRSRLAQGREGVASSGNMGVMAEYSKAAQDQMVQQEKAMTVTREKRGVLRQQIELAQKKNDTGTLQMLNERLSNAEREIKAADQSYIDSLTRRNQVELEIQAADRANATGFSNIINQGYELDESSLQQLSQQYNIPYEMAAGMYIGAESIRNDKTLSLQEKNLKLQEYQYDFQLKVDGYEGEQGRKAYQLSQMAASGDYSPAELGEYAQMMGLESKYNPLTQAELAYQSSRLKEASASTSGNQLSSGDVTEYVQNEVEFQNSLGQTSILMPNASKYGVTGTQGGIVVNVGDDEFIDDLSTKRDEGQCGAFVNDVLGIGITDLYSEKLADITSQVPQPGMAFVQSVAGENSKYGHVGIVESRNADGTINIVEANFKGPGIISRRRNVPIGAFDGFIKPDNSTQKTINNNDPSGEDGLYNQFLQEARRQGMQGESAVKFAEKRFDESYKPMTEGQSKAYNAYIMMKNEAETYDEVFKSVDNQKKLVNDINVITNKIKEEGLTPELINRTWISPTSRAVIMTEMRWIGAKLRLDSGAAITQDEYVSYGTQFFPRAGDDPAEVKRKAQARANAEAGAKGIMGPSGMRQYETEFGGNDTSSTGVTSKYGQIWQVHQDMADYETSNDWGSSNQSASAEFENAWNSL